MPSSYSISCCSIARREKTIFEAAGEIAGAGFSGIEVWYPHIEKMDVAKLRELREFCRKLGLRIEVISPYFSFTKGPERWEQSLKDAASVLQSAEILGVNKIRTFIDCGPDGVRSESATAEHWRAARDGLRALCAMNAETQFVVETHEYTLANTLPSARRVIDEVDRSNLRLNYQPTRDFMQRGYLECLEALYDAIAHMHWEQVDVNGDSTYLEEDGRIDFAELIHLLEKKKYSGTASVEYCWMPVAEGRVESAAKFLNGLLGEPMGKSAAPFHVAR